MFRLAIRPNSEDVPVREASAAYKLANDSEIKENHKSKLYF